MKKFHEKIINESLEKLLKYSLDDFWKESLEELLKESLDEYLNESLDVRLRIYGEIPAGILKESRTNSQTNPEGILGEFSKK